MIFFNTKILSSLLHPTNKILSKVEVIHTKQIMQKLSKELFDNANEVIKGINVEMHDTKVIFAMTFLR